jgi:hypothetical protein
MVIWAYIPRLLLDSFTYDIRIWIHIPRSRVLHSCLTATLICGRKHTACQIISDEGAEQKEEERGR